MKFVSVIFFLLILSRAYATVKVRGFSKLNAINYQSSFDDESNNEVFQINRISLMDEFRDGHSYEFSLEMNQIYSKLNSYDLKHNYKKYNRPYRIDDFNPNIVETNSYYLNINLDRAFYTFDNDDYVITVGRQQIAFGSARVTNPTDIFTPLSFTIIDRETRSGIDAIRIKRSLGEMGQIDIGIVPGVDSSRLVAYTQLTLPLANFEIKPMLSYFNKSTMIGLDLTTDYRGASVWFENALVKPKDERDYLRSVLGAQRLVTLDLSLFAEYYYNNAGSNKSSNYTEIVNKFAYQKGGVYLLGKDYFDAGASYQLSALQQLGISLKTNLNDHSQFFSLSWEWNFLENSYLNVGSYIVAGRKGSELGSAANTTFTRLRWYF